jgi:ribosome maturation protein Sdo1
MKINKKTIEKIKKKHSKAFEMLENYDKTLELPFQRKRIDVTLSVETLRKLRELKEKTGKPISRIIEEEFNRNK